MKERVLSLDERLFEYPYEYDFFQAVRLLHLILDDRVGVGRLAKPAEEPVRFNGHQSLEFPPSSIHALTSDSDPPRMTTSFLGLTGVQGVLPHHYTEHILARAISKDFAMAEFFDLFHHRMVSLFYRAWEKHQFPVRFQIAASRRESDEFTDYLFDWIGLGTAGLLERMSIRDQALIRYAGMLGQRPASAISLAAIIRDYFGAPVEVEEFVGGWCLLKEEDQCDLNRQDLNNRLGEGAVAGDAVWDQQGRFRIRIGPVTLARFLSFLPDGRAVEQLRDLVGFYVGGVLQFDLQLVLKASEVPFCETGAEGLEGPRLGWCAWLKTDGFQDDAADAEFQIK